MRQVFAEEVNLNLVHQLLLAANNQPYGFLKVRGTELVREVEQMAAAGLIDASPTVHGLETYAVINRLTATGDSFLRAFKKHPFPLTQRTLSLAEH
jgi:hypothetical protein